MHQIIDGFRRVRAYASETIEIYEVLSSRAEPEVKHMLVPLLYTRLKEYNMQQRLIDPVLLNLVGAWLAPRYRGLERFFVNEQTLEEMQETRATLVQMLTEGDACQKDL